MTKPTKDELLDLLDKNEYDYYVLPMYGLISDWYERYWELHNKLHYYLQDDTEH